MQFDFYQKRGFEKRGFKFTDKGLFVHYSKFFKTHEYELNYEAIGNRLIFSKKGIKAWLIAAILLLFASFVLLLDRLNGGEVEKGAEIFYLLPGIAFLTTYFLTYEKACYLVKSNNTNAIQFLIEAPSKKELEDFLTFLESKRKWYLLDMYGQINKNISYEKQHDNFMWLHDTGVITFDELGKKKVELDLVLQSNTVVSGFLSTNENGA